MTGTHPLELNRAVPGGRVEMFAIEDGDYPGGWFYRFQYYNLGWHHRHVSFGEDTGIEFQNTTAHVAHFLREVAYLTDTDHD